METIKNVLKSTVNILIEKRNISVKSAVDENYEKKVKPALLEMNNKRDAEIKKVEAERDSKISAIKDAAEQRINDIREDYDLQKKNFKQEEEDAITDAVGSEFDVAISGIQKVLEGGEA